MIKNKIKQVLIIILIFLFIYTPPIFSFNVLHLIAFFSYMVFLLNKKYRKTFIIFIKIKKVSLFLLYILFSVFLLGTIILLTTQKFIYLYNIVIIFLELLPISVLIAIFLKKNNYKTNDVLHLIISAGMLQALLSILTFVSPNFKSIIIDTFYGSYNDLSTMAYWVQYRVFGLSNGMMFAMPVTQGFLASLAFVAGLKISVKYYWYIPFLLFSAVINGRIGIVIFLINIIIVLFLNISKWKLSDVSKVVMIGIILALFIPQFLLSIESKSSTTFQWIVDGYNETINFFKGESTGYYGALNNMIFFPDSVTLVFGSGQDFFNQRFQSYSTDVGYINDLFLGGVFYVIMFYISILYYFFVKKKRGTWYYKFLPYMMIITMLVTNIKGYAFRQNEFLNLFFLIATILILYNKFDYVANGREEGGQNGIS